MYAFDDTHFGEIIVKRDDKSKLGDVKSHWTKYSQLIKRGIPPAQYDVSSK